MSLCETTPQSLEIRQLDIDKNALKEFLVSSGNVIVRNVDNYEIDDSMSMLVKIGKYKVYHEDDNLFVMHSVWFDQKQLNSIKDEEWIKKDFIHVSRGYIGVFVAENFPQKENKFDKLYWKINSIINPASQEVYVSKMGVVSDAQQGEHNIYVIKNADREIVGIKIGLSLM